MPSPAQIAAARANGAKSRGPNSEEGRRKVAFNAVRHGLTAKTIVLANESREQFQELLDICVAQLQPEGELEFGFVEEFAAARWRLRRFWGVETALLDLEMDRQENAVADAFERIDEPTRLALAFKGLADQSGSLSLLSRYETRYLKAQDRALRNLWEARKVRFAAQPPAVPPAESVEEAAPAEVDTPTPVANHPPEPSELPRYITARDPRDGVFAKRTQDRSLQDGPLHGPPLLPRLPEVRLVP
jgi:hypothetical protein